MTTMTAIKVGVWFLFVLSLFGYLLAAALSSKKVRQLIVELWYSVSTKIEARPSVTDVQDLFEQLLQVLLLKNSWRVSKLKALALAFVGVLFYSLGTYVQYSTSLAQWSYYFLPTIPAAIFIHWLVEFYVAYCFVAYYKRFSKLTLTPRVLSTTSIAMLAIALCAVTIFFAFMWLFNEVGLSPIVFLMVQGYFLAIASFLPSESTNRDPLAEVFFLISIAPQLIGLWSWFAVLLVSKSRLLLRSLQLFCEKTESLAAAAVFTVSSFLFAFATGLMQAASF